MSNLAEKVVFQPRGELPITLKYRNHIRWSYYACLVIAGLLFLFSIGKSAPQLLRNPLLENSILVLEFSFLPFILFLEAHFLLKPFAFSTVKVLNDRLEIYRNNKIIYVPFSEIIGVSFSYIPNLGGWFKLRTDQKTYRFTIVLERSDLILESIASYNNKLVPAGKLESYRRTAIIGDHTWNHFYGKFKYQKYWLNKYLLTPFFGGLAISSTLYFKNQTNNIYDLLSLIVILIGIQLVLSFVAWWLTSIALTWKMNSDLKKNPNDNLNNLKFKNQIETISQTTQKVLLLATVVTSCLFALLQ